MDEWIVGSDWLAAVGGEYGVTPGQHLATIDLGPPPATLYDADIQALVGALAADGGLDRDLNPPVFVLYTAAATEVALTAGQTPLCAGNDAYHASVDVGGPSPIPYAVIGDCPSPTSNLTDLAFTETSASHEIIESATDPFQFTAPGWINDDPQTQVWSSLYGEVADVCSNNFVVDHNYTLQRSWSNAAAEMDQDPCVPYPPGDLYYGVSTTPDGVLSIPGGQTVNIHVTGWSTAPRDDWYLYPYLGGYQDFCPTLGAPFDGGTCNRWNAIYTMNNGVELDFSLTVPAGVDAGALSSLMLLSYDATGASEALWPLQIQVAP
jgi:hypothetical protein